MTVCQRACGRAHLTDGRSAQRILFLVCAKGLIQFTSFFGRHQVVCIGVYGFAAIFSW